MFIFTSDLEMERVDGESRNGRPLYRLTVPLECEVQIFDEVLKFTIEQGFETERTSYPSFLDHKFGFDPKLNAKEAVVHDFLYQYKEVAFGAMTRVAKFDQARALKLHRSDIRKFTDQIFRMSLLRRDRKRLSRPTQIIMAWAHYLGVRLWGGCHYYSQSKN